MGSFTLPPLPGNMSSSTAIPISPQLAEAFKRQDARYFIVRIENEVLVNAYAHPKGASLESDWNTIVQKADNRAAYILVELAPRQWITITFLPAGTKIRDKMVYAATKATLLNHLGYQFFADELHANDNDELKYDYYVASKRPVNALSAAEELRNRVDREEEEERNYRATIHSPNLQGSSSLHSSGSGGYHSVALPLDASAEDLVRSIISGNNTFVELSINNAKNGISGVRGQNVALCSMSSSVNMNEPRYYLVKHQGKNALIYCCPLKSPPKLRMVYSTAKGSVKNGVGRLGFSVNKTGEITEASELNAQLLNELSTATPSPMAARGPSRASPGGGQVKSSRQSVIGGAHPVYSLMGNSPSSGRTKKVVLPPPGAY